MRKTFLECDITIMIIWQVTDHKFAQNGSIGNVASETDSCIIGIEIECTGIGDIAKVNPTVIISLTAITFLNRLH